jgi:hypothetical protein
MDIQNEYLPADRQDVDNITTLIGDESEEYSPEPYEESEYMREFKKEERTITVYIILGLGVMTLNAVLAYLIFMN